MTAITDDELLRVAPNIEVLIGTPPPFESVEFDPETIPQYLFTLVDIASKKTQTIGSDWTKYLIKKAQDKDPPSTFLIKVYGDPDTIPVTPLPPITTPPPPLPPLPGARPPSTTTPYPDSPEDAPFDEIGYIPRDLVPYKPLLGETVDPATVGFFKSFPSAVYIDAISSCISTPFVSPRPSRNHNGVLNDARTNSYYATYLWQWDDPRDYYKINKIPGPFQPRADGVIDVTAQHKSNKYPLPELYLDPGKWEKQKRMYNGDALNAFSLILGITPGDGAEQPLDNPWSIKIAFGDITVTLFEAKPEATVSIKGMETPNKIMLHPTTASYLTEAFGPRVVYITFIPVWNGLLISDGIVGSSNWGSSVTFIPKDKDLDINKEINKIVNPEPEHEGDPPNPKRPPKTVIQRKSPQGHLTKYQAPGVRISRGDNQIDFGTRLGVTYHRCGGAIKFLPIYFPPFSRYHLLTKGAVHPDDLKDAPDVEEDGSNGSNGSNGSGHPSAPISVRPNVFKIKSASDAAVMPIFSYETAQYLDFRTNLATIVKDKVKPWSCLSMEFEVRNTDCRRPMQVWGALIMDKSTFTVGSITQPPENADGVLSIASIPAHRIRSFSISRGLDGSSGTIVWDRFNPTTGQIDPRPFQQVGGLQVKLQGGANTVPGVAFTGLAYGNSERDDPGENLINVPIKGRESKLGGEGGLALVNVPFFDGYDHRDAMLYMANYAGFPIDISRTDPFRLISSYNIQNPILDFPSGTAVQQAMDTISTSAGSLYYFDRLGTLIYMAVERPTGVNWNYPDLLLESFSDEPDHTWVRNEILIFALVADASSVNTINVDYTTIPTQMVMLKVPLVTYPEFAWAKMAVYAIPQIVASIDEVVRQAVQVAKGQSRPRATARCRIPGNAQIELLDTINERWAVTSVGQEVDTQRKIWSTEIGVELIRPDIELGEIEILPMSDFG